MKKIIAIIVTVATVLSVGTVAFAQGPKAGKIADKVVAKVENGFTQEQKDQLSALRDTIKKNEEQIRTLKGDIRTAVTALKQQIEKLKESGATVSQDQIDQIKAVLASVKGERKEFVKDHHGFMKNVIPGIKEARKAMNFDTMKAKFDTITTEQNSRIADLQKILNIVKAINIAS